MALPKQDAFERFQPLHLDSGDSDASEPFLKSGHKKKQYHGRGSFIRSPAWFVLSIALLLIIFLESVFILAQPKMWRNAYEYGFNTELDFAKPGIKLQQKRFSSPIRDLPNGTLYTVFDPSEPRYVGPPSPEIDEAWNSLLRGRYILFSDDEASWLKSDSGLPELEKLPAHGNAIPQTGYYGGPDMLHSLHCINAIRQHLDMEHYKDQMWLPEEYQRMHIDHCIEQLRQATLCHADMTPVTLKAIWTDRPRWVALGQTERLHTCRDGMALRERTWRKGDETARISFA